MPPPLSHAHPMRLALASVLLLLVLGPGSARADAEVDAARALLLTGRYDEARAAWQRLAVRAPVPAAIGLARTLDQTGQLEAAIAILATALRRHPDPALHAERARLELERGALDSARAAADAALASDPDQPLAHWVTATLDRDHGRLDEANEGYRWFVHFYNDRQDSLRDPEVLRLIGLAGAEYARWNRNSGQFSFLVNTLYPDILKLDPRFWPAHLEEARLFLEKFNTADARAELDSALAINPRAAEAHAERARLALQEFDLDAAGAALDRALEIDPRLVTALDLRADVALLATGPRAAFPTLERARALAPTDEETLGRLAAAYGAVDGLRDTTTGRTADVIHAVEHRNPHCGTFFAAMAASLDLMQRFPDAARFDEEARRRMPQLVSVPGHLGLLAMRLGDETHAREVLNDAAGADPFNVRVRNSLQVLELLDGYGTVETPHFVVRFDRGRDSLLARYAARHLERDVWPSITEAFGFTPPGRTMFEIFSAHEHTDGHGWFSARVAGLPFVGVVAACPGGMVALTSPGDGVTFNWARVMRHEFVHVVNLQQNAFSIPRWFTEGLAVWKEGPGHPRAWDEVLARRVAEDSLFDLGTIQRGFTRPRTSDDWTLAYYQALLYVQFFAKRFGPGAPNRLIAAYRDHLDTPAAVQRSFGVSSEALQREYAAFVRGQVESGGPEPPGDLRALERAHAEHPKDAHVLARLAWAQFHTDAVTARKEAEQALAIDPREQLAAYVLALTLLRFEEKPRSLEVLKAALDASSPQPNALVLLAQLEANAKDFAAVEKLAHIGRARWPHAANWDAMLVLAYRHADQRDSLTAALTRVAEGDPDDGASRLELAAAAAAAHAPEAERWAREVIDIDVRQPDAHGLLADALARRSAHAEAEEEYAAAAALQPDHAEWTLGEAREAAALGDRARARELVRALLVRDPANAGARQLMGALGGGR